MKKKIIISVIILVIVVSLGLIFLKPKREYNRAKDKRENEKIIKEWEEEEK